MVVFVDGPLPGERARVRLTDVKAKYAVGEVLERETTSPDRAVPFCPAFGACGGCQVQHLAYPAQLAWKHRIVTGALVRIGGFTGVTVNAPIGMDSPRAYRNKMALVVDAGAGEPVFGFYRARSHDLVPIDHCPIVLDQLDAAIGGLQQAARDPHTAGAFAAVKHVVMRAGLSSPNSVLSLTTDAKSPAIAAGAAAIATHIPGVDGISNSYEPANANAVIGRRMDFVWGKREMEETIEGVRFRVSPVGLRRFAVPSGLHPYHPAGAPLARSSGALPYRDSRLPRSPFRSALRARGVPVSRLGVTETCCQPCAVGSEEARSVALALASVRRTNWTCRFPASSFHEDALL